MPNTPGEQVKAHFDNTSSSPTSLREWFETARLGDTEKIEALLWCCQQNGIQTALGKL
jgi:hypothetical protein